MEIQGKPYLRLELLHESDRILLDELVKQAGPALRATSDGPLAGMRVIVRGEPFAITLLMLPALQLYALDDCFVINPLAEVVVHALSEQAAGKDGGFLAAHFKGPLVSFGWKTASGENRFVRFLVTAVDRL